MHIEHSLSFAYFNQGKCGVCVDLDSPAGQTLLHDMARNADLLIHSCSPQHSFRNPNDHDLVVYSVVGGVTWKSAVSNGTRTF